MSVRQPGINLSPHHFADSSVLRDSPWIFHELWYGMGTSSEMPDVRFYTYCSAHLNTQGTESRTANIRLRKNTAVKRNFLFDNIYPTVSRGTCWNSRTIFIMIRSLCADRTVNTPPLHTSWASAKICSHLKHKHNSLWSGKTSFYNNTRKAFQKSAGKHYWNLWKV